MGIGFPAHHTGELPDPLSIKGFRQSIVEAIRELNWSLVEESDETITAATKLNLWSWGERVKVDFHSRGATITSKCILFSQCFDWGKNKSNVRKLIDKLYESSRNAS